MGSGICAQEWRMRLGVCSTTAAVIGRIRHMSGSARIVSISNPVPDGSRALLIVTYLVFRICHVKTPVFFVRNYRFRRF